MKRANFHPTKRGLEMGITAKIFIGMEYECPRGHRFISGKKSPNFFGQKFSSEIMQFTVLITGKSFSEVLIRSSTNPQYDKRLSIDLLVQYIKIPNLEHGENIGRTCCLHKLF